MKRKYHYLSKTLAFSCLAIMLNSALAHPPTCPNYSGAQGYIGNTYIPNSTGGNSSKVGCWNISTSLCSSAYFNQNKGNSAQTYYTCSSNGNSCSDNYSQCNLASTASPAKTGQLGDSNGPDSNSILTYGETNDGKYICCTSSYVGNNETGGGPSNNNSNHNVYYWALTSDGCGQRTHLCTAATQVFLQSTGLSKNSPSQGTLNIVEKTNSSYPGYQYILQNLNGIQLGPVDNSGLPQTLAPLEYYYNGGAAASGAYFWTNCSGVNPDLLTVANVLQEGQGSPRMTCKNN